jgi:hypothetical protein
MLCCFRAWQANMRGRWCCHLQIQTVWPTTSRLVACSTAAGITVSHMSHACDAAVADAQTQAPNADFQTLTVACPAAVSVGAVGRKTLALLRVCMTRRRGMELHLWLHRLEVRCKWWAERPREEGRGPAWHIITLRADHAMF